MDRTIQDHLEELMVGENPEGTDINREELPLNLLLFGFSMRNASFNALLKSVVKKKKKKLNIYVFDANPELPAYIKSIFKEANDADERKVNVYAGPVLDTHYALEKNLEKLWAEIENVFERPYVPKGIARHQLVNHIFRGHSPVSLADESTKKIYHEDRLFVEIALLMIENDGIVHLRQLSGGRAGKFYAKLNEEKGSRSIHSYLKRMGMKPYQDFMFDTYYVENPETRNKEDDLIEFVREKLLSVLQNCRSRVKGKKKTGFVKFAKAARTRRLLRINPKYKNVHDNLFSNIGVDDVMNTSLAWIFNYRKMMTEEIGKWDVMLAVSEQGRFLNYDIQNTDLSKKQFEIILAKNNLLTQKLSQEEILESELNLLTGLRYRPWWVHNKHMVIFLKRKKHKNTGNWKEDWKLVRGFFYTHRLLSRRINPIRVTNEKDIELLMIMFAIYWEGSSSETLSQSISLVTQKVEVDRVLNELLSKYKPINA